MTSRILFEWQRSNTLITVDLLVDCAVFEEFPQVFEVVDHSPKKSFYDKVGDAEKLGMRMVATVEDLKKDRLSFFFIGRMKYQNLPREWRDIIKHHEMLGYKSYLEQFVPPDFASIRKTLDCVWDEAAKNMGGPSIVNLHFHIQVDRKNADGIARLANQEGWTITSSNTELLQDITLSSRINREYLQALGELSTLFVNSKKLGGRVVGFGLEAAR